MATAAASSPAAVLAFLTRPLSLLRHVAHGCAGYLGGLASRLKPAAAAADAAAACQPQREEGSVEAAALVTEEEVLVVQVRSRAMAPQRPRGLKEGKGGNGGAHRK
ncbi:uncharacterized protein LOC112897902 isoform X2 [Panicum hallii]|nr:uncharacterized protein LOC112897902 isoform X2 [Panicum hallii]